MGAVVVVGGAAIFYFSRAPTADFDQPHWAQLCLSYDSWFGDFVAGMSTDTTRKKFAANPDYPAGALKIVEASAAKLDAYDPTRLAKSARSLTDLAVMPTPDAKSGQNAYKTRQADDLIAKVSAALQPGQWGLLTKLDQTEKAYRERGWLKPANAIKGLIAAAEPPGLPANPPGEGAPAPRVERVDELANIERTVAAGKAVEQVEARWAKIQSELKMLPGGGAGGSGGVTVPLLAAFPKFAEDLARSLDIITRIRMKGMRLSLDDFGTGHSSIDRLRRYPFNEVKIDRSFVAGLPHDLNSRRIVSSIIQLAQQMSMSVVAEGIENDEQLELLRGLGCDEIQGYFVARPMAPEDLPAWVLARASCPQRND